MRLLLAVLAVLGLLLTPAAATAATARCVHEGHGAMPMSMPSGTAMVMAPEAPGDEAAAPMPCCDDDGTTPHHDSNACAQDCALMCAAPVALPDAVSPAAPLSGHARLTARPSKPYQGQAPPGLKRPPRAFI